MGELILQKNSDYEYDIKDETWYYWRLVHQLGAISQRYNEVIEMIRAAIGNSIVPLGVETVLKIRNCLSDNHPLYPEISALLDKIIALKMG